MCRGAAPLSYLMLVIMPRLPFVRLAQSRDVLVHRGRADSHFTLVVRAMSSWQDGFEEQTPSCSFGISGVPENHLPLTRYF